MLQVCAVESAFKNAVNTLALNDGNDACDNRSRSEALGDYFHGGKTSEYCLTDASRVRQLIIAAQETSELL